MLPPIIPHEAIAILGIGIIGFVGHNVLLELGHKTLAISLDVVLTLAAGIIAFYYIMFMIAKAAAMFGIYVMWH